MDPIEEQLRAYYEAEALARLRPEHGERRRVTCERFASRSNEERRRRVVDVGAGPASDHAPFAASLFNLPFKTPTFPAGWSMSTFQHVPDHRIDTAMAEFVRVLEPGAPVTIGLWGGRDEVIESASRHDSTSTPQRSVMVGSRCVAQPCPRTGLSTFGDQPVTFG